MAMGPLNRSRVLGCLLTGLLGLWGWLGAAEVTVTLYNTGDLHENSANLARIAAVVASRRARDPNVLFVDCGDTLNRGDPEYTTTRGEAMFATLSTCGFDASVMGNHELSFGAARAVELFDRFDRSLLDANTVWPAGLRPRQSRPYRVVRLQGVSVALIGTASEHINHASDALVTRRPVPDALRELLPLVRAEADIVVLLTHVGTERDEAIAASLGLAFPGPRPAVDLIIGAHDHQAYPALRLHAPSGIAIQHSGDRGRCVGETTLVWDGTRVTERRSRLISMTPDMPEEPGVAAVRERYRQRLPPEHALLWLDGPVAPVAFAGWLGGLAATAAGVDIALLPADAMRGPLPAGGLTPAALFGGLKRVEPMCFEVADLAELDQRLQTLTESAKRPLVCRLGPVPEGRPLRVAWFCVYVDALTPTTADLGPLLSGVGALRRAGGLSLWEVVLAAGETAHGRGEACPIVRPGTPLPTLGSAAQPGEPK